MVRGRHLARRAAIVALIGMAVWAATRWGPGFTTMADRVRGLGPWGPLAFGVAYVGSVVAMVPASPLTLAAGAIFGVGTGFLVVVIASNVGATLAFLIARSGGRGPVSRWLARRPRLAALDSAVDRGGWKVVALLRLSPVVPFNVLNYALGLTSVRFGPSVAATAVAMLPGTLLYVSLGDAGLAGLEAASGGRSRTAGEWALLGVGVAATAAVTAWLGRLARRSALVDGTRTGDARTPGTPRPGQLDACSDDPAVLA